MRHSDGLPGWHQPVEITELPACPTSPVCSDLEKHPGEPWLTPTPLDVQAPRTELHCLRQLILTPMALLVPTADP